MQVVRLNGDWSVTNERTGGRYEASVPGYVQKDLMAQGELPGLYDTRLEPKLERTEYDDWTYRRTFALDADMLAAPSIELVFEGIDTYAEIALNGQVLGRTENMFVPVRFDIKAAAAAHNELTVRIFSPTNTLLAKERAFGEPLQLWNGIPARLFGRKAQYGYGWDWGPRLVTTGIHKPVFIEAHAGLRAGTPGYNLTHVSQAKAIVQAEVPVTYTGPSEAADAEIVWRLYEADAHTPVAERRDRVRLGPGATMRCVSSLEVAEPKLWYPAGYGEQPLYRLEATVAPASGEGGVEYGGDDDSGDDGGVSAADAVIVSCTVGIRTVRILQPYDEQGRKFILEVNGIPVLAKGVNWIPLTLFPNLDTPEDYARDIAGIAAANMNMIRIWGGGTYENHAFYDECDRRGILVWQDFMFACGDYPDDDAFCALVRDEVDHVTRELGYHPSIVLWCGNNENQHFILQSRKHRREGYGERLFFDVIGEACAHDTLRPYWPTSPYDLSVEGSGDSQDRGDMHYWQVWGQTQPYENYGTINARFVSEFGMQSYPSMKVMDGVDAEADLRDPQFDAMQKAPNGIQRLLYYTAGDYRLPADKRGFVYVNQLMQANALRLAVEHWMSRMPDTSGALIWQWADLWPSISWAIVDFDKVHKPSYFYMKRSFQSPNAIAQIEPGAAEAELYLIHEKGDFNGRVTVEFYDIEAGETIRTEELAADGTGYRSTRIGSVSVDGLDPSRVAVFVHLYEGDTLLARNSYLLGKPLRLRLKPAGLEVRQEADGGDVLLTVTSAAFAKDVWLPDVPGALSDNGFDLKAGESRTIRIPGGVPEGAKLVPVCLNDVQGIGYI